MSLVWSPHCPLRPVLDLSLLFIVLVFVLVFPSLSSSSTVNHHYLSLFCLHHPRPLFTILVFLLSLSSSSHHPRLQLIIIVSLYSASINLVLSSPSSSSASPGLEYIHQLTQSGDYEMRVDLQDWANETRWAKYEHFSLTNEEHNYTLSLGDYEGTAGQCSRSCSVYCRLS